MRDRVGSARLLQNGENVSRRLPCGSPPPPPTSRAAEPRAASPEGSSPVRPAGTPRRSRPEDARRSSCTQSPPRPRAARAVTIASPASDARRWRSHTTDDSPAKSPRPAAPDRRGRARHAGSQPHRVAYPTRRKEPSNGHVIPRRNLSGLSPTTLQPHVPMNRPGEDVRPEVPRRASSPRRLSRSAAGFPRLASSPPSA